LWNVLPEGQESGFGSGVDINAGADLEQRQKILALLGDIYITFEGDAGVSQEVREAYARGASVVPVMRTGGASAGMFDFPQGVLSKPSFATENQWSRLANAESPISETAAAVVDIVSCIINPVNDGTRTKIAWKLLEAMRDGSLEQLLAEASIEEHERVQPGSAIETLCGHSRNESRQTSGHTDDEANLIEQSRVESYQTLRGATDGEATLIDQPLAESPQTLRGATDREADFVDLPRIESEQARTRAAYGEVIKMGSTSLSWPQDESWMCVRSDVSEDGVDSPMMRSAALNLCSLSEEVTAGICRSVVECVADNVVAAAAASTFEAD
jgi:hypothetical protein